MNFMQKTFARIGSWFINQSNQPPQAYIDALLEQYSSGGYSYGTGVGGLLGRLNVVRFATAYRCVSMIASFVSRAPLKVYHKETGKVVKPGRANRGQIVAALLHRGIDTRYPNRELLSLMATDLAFDGACYLAIKGSYSVPIELELTQSQGAAVYLEPTSRGASRIYWLRSTYGDTIGPLPENKVVHANLVHCYTGQQGRIRGVGPVAAIGNAVNAGTSGDEFIRKELAGEGLHNRLLYAAAGELKAEQIKQLQETFDAAVRSRSQRPLVLQNMGAKGEGDRLEDLGGFALQNSKGLAELRDFQVADVARAFGVPLAMLGVKGTNYGNAIAEYRRAFVDMAVRPYMDAIESAITYRLLAATDYEVRFELPASLNTDLVAMAAALPKLLGGTQGPPVLSVNEARLIMNLERWEDPKYDKPIDPADFHSGGNTGDPPQPGEDTSEGADTDNQSAANME